MRKNLKAKGLLFLAVVVVAMVAVQGAFAAATFPTSSITTAVGGYGDGLIAALVSAFTVVWPYAAVITGIAIVAGMLKRWAGHRSATKV